MQHLALRSAALVALLTAAPACRGCLVDGITYDGEGGATAASTGSDTTATTADASASSSSASGATTTSSSGSSAGGGASGSGGAGGNETSTGGGSAAGTGGSGGAPPSCPRSDDFDTGAEELSECWSSENPGSAVLAGDRDVVTLTAGGPGLYWYNQGEGVFHFQLVLGDFSAVLPVSVESRPGNYQLAGFLLRNPDDGVEDWLRSDVGFLGGEAGSIRVASTVDGESMLLGTDNDGYTEAVLGVCRRDQQVILAWLLDGQEWIDGGVVLDPDDDLDAPVPDFDEEIEVGFNVSSSDSNPAPEITATFDAFRLSLGSGDCLERLEALWP